MSDAEALNDAAREAKRRGTEVCIGEPDRGGSFTLETFDGD